MKTLGELYRLGSEWLKNTGSFSPILIVYHRDADGVCAAALLSKALRKLGKNRLNFLPSDQETTSVTNDLMYKILEKKPDYVIFVDLSVDQNPNTLALIKQKLMARMLVIDHHPAQTDLNGLGIMHLNSHFAEPEAYLPASYLIYNICKPFGIEDYDWVALVGIAGDHGIETCWDFVTNFMKRNRITMTAKKIYSSDFMKAANMIDAAKAFGKIEIALEVFDNASLLEQTMHSAELLKMLAQVQNLVQTHADKFEKEADFNKPANTAFYRFKDYLQVESMIANTVSQKYPRTSVAVCREYENKIRCSFRNSGGTQDVGKIVKMSVIGLSATGGGHPQAAGATLDKKDFAQFKSNVIMNASKQYVV